MLSMIDLFLVKKTQIYVNTKLKITIIVMNKLYNKEMHFKQRRDVTVM